MKKALIALALLAAAIYVASWFWAGGVIDAAAARPWPDSLGALDAVPGRYPPHPGNEAARKLTNLAAHVVANEAVTAYVRQEIARDTLAIAEPPAIADISAVRELLLREPVVWNRNIKLQHGGLLQYVATMQSLTRNLVASALARGRRQDVAAWDDLRAAWNLTASLDEHPHVVVRVVEMSMARAINAVAWKMPLPAPAWFDDVQHRDFVRPLLETMQYENWRRWRVDQIFPLKPFADRIERERTLAAALTRMTACGLDRAPETGDRWDPIARLDVAWQRAFRYRAEREAAANALRARAGRPIVERSQCRDGGWSFDGKTLRFTKPITLPERRDTSMPLTLTIK